MEVFLMKVTVVDSVGLEKKITIEVDAATVSEKINAIAGDLAERVRVPGGYRKRKAKISRVKQMFRKQISAEATSVIIEETLMPAIEEHGLKPIGMPRVVDLDTPTAGKDMVYVASVETFPAFDNLAYKGLVYGESPIVVSDEDVDGQVELLQKQASQLEDAPGKAIAEGQMVRLSVAANTDDEQLKEKFTATSTQVTMDEQLSRKVYDALLGQPFDFKTTMEASPLEINVPGGEFAEQILNWDVEVTKVMELKVPVIDDAFAMETKGLKSLLALRGQLREELTQEKQQLADKKARYLLTQQLLETNRFDLPSRFIRDVYEDRVKAFKENLSQYGGSVDDSLIEKLVESRRAEELDGITRDAAEYLLLQAIADSEGIEVGDEELEKKLGEMAAEQGVQVSFLKGKMSEDELKSVGHGLRTELTYKMIEAQAVRRDFDEFMRLRVEKRKLLNLMVRGRPRRKAKHAANRRRRAASA